MRQFLGREPQAGNQESEGADFIVGVDSGSIALSRGPYNIERGHSFYRKIQDGALWTAKVAWDGKAGAIGTPVGDGPHRVFYDPSVDYGNWQRWRSYEGVFLINEPPGKPQKPFELFMGDHGVAGKIRIPEHTLVALIWIDSTTLQVIVENKLS